MARLFGDRGEEKGEQGSGEACKLHSLQHQLRACMYKQAATSVGALLAANDEQQRRALSRGLLVAGRVVAKVGRVDIQGRW
jgi:hypothetical protein